MSPEHENAPSDHARNKLEYSTFWSQKWRRTWTYTTQSKLKHFRATAASYGFLKRPDLRVFDQGFGMGLMLFCFDRTCELAGLELSPSAVDQAAACAKAKRFRKVDLRVYDPEIGTPAEWQSRFDFVISSHVLEHLAQPRQALDGLVSLLLPGGHICILVPINERPGDDLNHFSLFTEDSAKSMVTEAGLEITETRSFDRLWGLVRPLSQRLQKRPTTSDRCLSLIFNAIFSIVPLAGLRLIDVVLGKLRKPNCQCLILARKRGGPPVKTNMATTDVGIL